MCSPSLDSLALNHHVWPSTPRVTRTSNRNESRHDITSNLILGVSNTALTLGDGEAGTNTRDEGQVEREAVLRRVLGGQAVSLATRMCQSFDGALIGQRADCDVVKVVSTSSARRIQNTNRYEHAVFSIRSVLIVIQRQG